MVADAFPQDACATTDSDGDDFPDSLADGCASTTSPPLTEDIDDDNDGLIEIHDLTMLHNMRYNLAGTTYDDEADDDTDAEMGDTTGGPTGATDNCKTATGGLYLCGYELMQDLDFDTDGDGTYTGAVTAPTLDDDDNMAPYFVDADGGWQPIGSGPSSPFTATFEGNGFVIRNLTVNRNLDYIGLFGYVSGSRIRNLGLEQVLVRSTRNGEHHLGGLVGLQIDGGTIIACYVTGNVVSSGNSSSSVRIGGLVGRQANNNIIASYASADVHCDGNGSAYQCGGLIGVQDAVTVIASYATGAVTAGTGNNGRVGGLIGFLGNIMTASYATGNADAGMGTSEGVGILIGNDAGFTNAPTSSYGFGEASNGTMSTHGTPPSGLTSATALNSINAGDAWNQPSSSTQGVWDFGDANQLPALVYNEYDGAGGTDYCAIFMAASLPCGSLLPGQRQDTSPQIGSATGDIKLGSGDSQRSITKNVTLPASVMVDSTTVNLTWSVFHDPQATNKVSIAANALKVDGAGQRASTRRIVLRATNTASNNIVNDYHLRVIAAP